MLYLSNTNQILTGFACGNTRVTAACFYFYVPIRHVMHLKHVACATRVIWIDAVQTPVSGKQFYGDYPSREAHHSCPRARLREAKKSAKEISLSRTVLPRRSSMIPALRREIPCVFAHSWRMASASMSLGDFI